MFLGLACEASRRWATAKLPYCLNCRNNLYGSRTLGDTLGIGIGIGFSPAKTDSDSDCDHDSDPDSDVFCLCFGCRNQSEPAESSVCKRKKRR
jgi:hypothetical protein